MLMVTVMVEETQPSFLKDTHSQDAVSVVGRVTRYMGQSKWTSVASSPFPHFNHIE